MTANWITANGRTPEGLAVIKARNQARSRALQRLRRAHQAEFERYLEEEAAKTPSPRSRARSGDDELREMYGV